MTSNGASPPSSTSSSTWRLLRGSPIHPALRGSTELLDVRPAWGSGMPNADSVVSRRTFTVTEQTLVANLLGSSERLAGWRPSGREGGEGSPLFLEETFGNLVDGTLLVPAGWTAVDELADVAVPPLSISALLAARLDRLTPQERAVIEAAAVVGREFSISVVRDLLPEDARDRVPWRPDGARAQGSRPARARSLPGEDAMRFRHLLIRDAAYEAIAKTRRAELHERVADRLEERRHGEGEHEEIVGYHLERAWAYRTLLGPPRCAVPMRSGRSRRSARVRGSTRAAGDAPAAVNLLGRALKVGSRAEVASLVRVPLGDRSR